MPDNTALAPDNRALYGEILRPPAGYELDLALATTYTLDFETALVIPATLAFHAAETRQETLDTPLALLEGLERLASRIAIFCEAGRIKAVPKQASPLTALLEETVTEVLAPRGGAFHPKLWVLRFKALDKTADHMRLAILSRNLTTDTSWDLSLVLDGVVGSEKVSDNLPLVTLLRTLPKIASGRPTPDQNTQIARGLAKSLAQTRWKMPEHVHSVSFAVNGVSPEVWQPRVGRNLGVISPFVTDGALRSLVKNLPPEACYLLGRSEEMALLDPETLNRFEHLKVLDDMAETEDGEEVETGTDPAKREFVPAHGLHAKAFFTERYSSTEITIGSGNATSAALLPGNGKGQGTANVEIFATLSGYSRNLGTVEDQFSPDNLGRFLRDFTPLQAEKTPSEIAAETRFDNLRKSLVNAGLTLHCRDAEDGRVALFLSSLSPVTVPDGMGLQIWSLVPGANYLRSFSELGTVKENLAELALVNVTRWLGVRLQDKATGLDQEFTLGADLHDLPQERTAHILRSLIKNKGAFLQYLRLLLSDLSDMGNSLFGRGTGGTIEGGFASGPEAPILEDMVKALSGDGRQLHDIDRLIARLSDPDTGECEVIPEDFKTLWETFRQVMDVNTAT